MVGQCMRSWGFVADELRPKNEKGGELTSVRDMEVVPFGFALVVDEPCLLVPF